VQAKSPQEKGFRPLFKKPSRTQPVLKRVLLIAGAVISFLVGILGWLVPVITGIPFYILGLILLGMASPGIIDWVNRGESRLPTRWRRRLRAGLRKIPIKKIREAAQ
jgi:ABC-type uncharacterized transport system permease subunit